jgi:hypothetical protein
MIIERTKNEVIFRLPGKASVDDLQSVADLLKFLDISRKSKATQKQVNVLVKRIKKGRWNKTKARVGL